MGGIYLRDILQINMWRFTMTFRQFGSKSEMKKIGLVLNFNWFVVVENSIMLWQDSVLDKLKIRNVVSYFFKYKKSSASSIQRIYRLKGILNLQEMTMKKAEKSWYLFCRL